MATINMVCGAIVFLVGAVLYSSLVGADYLATFFNNPFNIMFLGLGVPMILIGIGLDLGIKINKQG